MCIICLDFQKSKLTIDEAWRVMPEMKQVIDTNHLVEVRRMLAKAMDREREDLEKSQKEIEEREYDDA